MNKKLDFYNGKGTSQAVDYTPETHRRVGNRKLGLIIALSLVLVMDIVVTTLLGIVTKGVKYFITPTLITLLDALFLADLFFINLKQKYTIGHRVLYVVLSIVLTFITAMIPAADESHRIMAMSAVLIFLAVQMGKVILLILLYHLDKKSEFALKDRVASVILIVLLSAMIGSYSLWNYNVGFMGQYVRFGDEKCTLMYSLNEKGEYEVIGSFGDGNVIAIPETFDDKPVTAIDCSFIDASITKIVVEGKDIRFLSTGDIRGLNEELRVCVHKEALDTIRLGLFNDCWTKSGEATNAKTLFDSVTPDDLAAGESYYNVSCTDAFTSKTVGYVPTIYKADGTEANLNDLKEKMDPAKKQLFERTNVRDQGDLRYCFENNNRMILTRGDAEESDFFLTLEEIYRFTIGTGEGYHGNDKKWSPTLDERERYSVASGLVDYYTHLPKRDGFSVTWSTDCDVTEPYALASAQDFRAFVLEQAADTFDLTPEWAILPPTIERVPAPDVKITYGESADLEIETKCAFPIKYSLQRGEGIAFHIEETVAGNWSYAMWGKVPDDSDTYVLVMSAHPSSEVTSLGYSLPIDQRYQFTVDKKTLRLNWELPSGEFNNEDRAITLAYDTRDRVGADVIEVYPDKTSVKNAGNYTVNATMDAASDRKYAFSLNPEYSAARSFTIEKKTIVVDWRVNAGSVPSEEATFNYVYNGAVQSPVATTTVFNVTEYLELTEGNKDAGSYTVFATAREIGSNNNGVTIDTNNYRILENGNKNYVIEKKTLTIASWTTNAFTYDGSAHVTEVSEMNGYVAGEGEIALADLVYSGNSRIVSGDHDVFVTLRSSSNYTFGAGAAATVEYSMHIEPKVISYAWGSLSLDYNKQAQHPIAMAQDLCGDDQCAFTYDGEGTNAGDYVVTIIGVTNANYKLAAGEHKSDFTIKKILRPAFGVNYPDRTYGDDAPTPTYSGNEENGAVTYAFRAENEDDAVYSDVVRVLAGDYVIRAVAGETTNYLETKAERHYKIYKKALSIEWNDIDLDYSRSEKVPTPTVVNRVGADDVSVTASLKSGDNVNVGGFTFAADEIIGTSKENYTLTGAAGKTSKLYTITPHAITLSWQVLSASELIYDKTAKSVSASPVGLYTGDTTTVKTSLNSGSNVNVGTFTVRATLGNANYTLSDPVSGGYTITPKSVTVTVNSAEIEYGAAKPAFTLDTQELIAGDALTGSPLYATDYNVSNAASRGVGSYDVTVSGVSNANYDITFGKGTLTVTSRKVALIWDFTSVVYDKEEHLPVADLANKAYADDTVEFGYNTSVAERNVGSYSRSVTSLSGAQAEDYTLTGGTGLTNAWGITARKVTVKVNDVNITYGDPKPDFSLDTSALIAGDSLSGAVGYINSYDTSGWSSRKAGKYDITVSSVRYPSNDNYDITFAKGTLTVSQLPVVLSWSADSYVYDGATHLPTATIENTVYDLDEYLSVTYDESIQRKSAGNYSRTVTGFNVPAAYGDNYTVVGGTNVTLLWSITPRAVDVKVNDLTISYGETPNYTLDTSALYAGDTLTGTAIYTTDYLAGDATYGKVGNYSVSVSGLTNASYDITFVAGTLYVNKATRATVVVTISDIDEGEILNPSVTSVIEEPLGTTVTYLYGKKDSIGAATATPPTDAGEYYVIARLSASENYSEAESSARYFTIRSV